MAEYEGFDELRSRVDKLVVWARSVDGTAVTKSQLSGVESRLERLTDARSQAGKELAAAQEQIKRLADGAKISAEAFEKAVRKFDDEFKSAGRRLRALETDVVTLADQVRNTQREVELLERKVRQIDAPGSKAEIDTWALGQAELAAEISAGRKAARKLRALADTEALERRIARHDEHVDELRTRRGQAIAAARELASLEPDAIDEAWLSPMRAWNKHHKAAIALAEELDSSAADAQEAKAELAVQSQRSSELQPAVERGRRAEERLWGRVHGYMESVVAADQFLPIWMVNALGPGLPRQNWRGWMSAAVGIIFYRVVYQVTSLVDALGERPAQEGERQDEYDRLYAETQLPGGVIR
ncbi:putative nucleic acid-binding Zn-ribbon protein [Kibdelosporangium banguiense]|uniref:Nucleic acid-binding Zn-ribbon protein n=1 Tax=Kibdelosporangium banguiense TaxID=1365924 RepID=A0ABS4TCD9_9PSEU|nr:hypothetical protein [Kibdelosporangium banguiense]MBP2321506.1 putative nucleic acid-binding Zn-ribbon protein [Kibdelosporangium banguiense]